jgi:hypothetical protein
MPSIQAVLTFASLVGVIAGVLAASLTLYLRKKSGMVEERLLLSLEELNLTKDELLKGANAFEDMKLLANHPRFSALPESDRARLRMKLSELRALMADYGEALSRMRAEFTALEPDDFRKPDLYDRFRKYLDEGDKLVTKLAEEANRAIDLIEHPAR